MECNSIEARHDQRNAGFRHADHLACATHGQRDSTRDLSLPGVDDPRPSVVALGQAERDVQGDDAFMDLLRSEELVTMSSHTHVHTEAHARAV